MFLNLTTHNKPQKKEQAMEKRHIVSSAMLLLSVGVANAQLSSVIEHRSQSSNNARKVAGEFGYVHLRDQDSWYTRTASTFEYQRSFNPNRLARSLFGCYVDDCDAIKIQGSAVEDRDENALFADYFYLPTDFDSVVSVKPVISDLIFDYNLYVGFNFKCIENAYFRVYAPLVRSKWMLNMKECIVNAGTNDYAPGYFMPCEVIRDDMNVDFCDYISGGAPFTQCATILNGGRDQEPNPLDLGNELATTSFRGLDYYRGSCCDSRTETTLADLRMELGWNFWNKECYHLGVNAQAAFPTGTRPDAQYMFNPVVGNGKHWEFGGGITGHYILWECGDYEKSIGINLDANLTYLFENHEQRTFDLVDKDLSRFMLAQRVGRPFAISAGAMAAGDDVDAVTVPCGQFKYEYSPVANLTTLDIRVKASLQADIALWLNYTNRNMSVDLGYNLWARSHDEIRVDEVCGCAPECANLCDPSSKDTWVLKGDSQVYGFVQERDMFGLDCNPNYAVPLSPSQSRATITGGAPVFEGQALDNQDLAWGNLNNDELNREPLFTDPVDGIQVNTSNSPIYLRCEDIDLCARNRGISNKVWTNLQYTWDLDGDCNPMRCKPFLGLGAEVEFGKMHDDGCDLSSTCTPSTSCPSTVQCTESCIDDCGRVNVAVSQWGIWLKGGMNFE